MKKCLILLLAVALLTALPMQSAQADPNKNAIRKAMRWLKKRQLKDGSYGVRIPLKDGAFKEVGDVGITGLVVVAMAKSPSRLRPGHGPFISKAVDYLLKHRNKDGSIAAVHTGLTNYQTSIALMALVAVNDQGKYDKPIAAARAFLVKLQASEANGYDPKKHKIAYGGFGYGGDLRPDLSNTVKALEALHVAGLARNHPLWARSVKFLSRTQNLSTHNDFDRSLKNLVLLSDGGFRYAPDESKGYLASIPKGRRAFPSYASMTYAGLLSLLYAHVDKNDPRVQAAYRWIRRNYSLERNIGMANPKRPRSAADGLYYNYHVMAKALNAYGEMVFTDRKQGKRNWARELAGKLLSTQSKDGSWINSGSSRWWEDQRVLVTSYAVMSLTICYNNINQQKEEIRTLKAERTTVVTALAKAKKQKNEKAIARLSARQRRIDRRVALLKLHDKLKPIRARIRALKREQYHVAKELAMEEKKGKPDKAVVKKLRTQVKELAVRIKALRETVRKESQAVE